MIFDLEESKGVWFDFPGGGRVQLRAPTVSETIKIFQDSVTIKPFLHEREGKAPIVLNQEIVDEDKRQRLLNDISIVSWETFFDKNETEIPCIPENKTALMRLKDPTFRDFVNEKLSVLMKIEKDQKEAEPKNS